MMVVENWPSFENLEAFNYYVMSNFYYRSPTLYSVCEIDPSI
jgi:hypothetical protein